MDIQNGDSEALASSKPRPKKRSILGAARRYWYIVLLALIAIVVAVVFIGGRVRSDNTWKRAQDAYTKADYATAAAALKGQSVPTDAARLKVYAESMLATRQLDKSLPAYERMYELKKDPDTQIKIGNILNEQKKYDLAAKSYQEVIASHPTFIQAYINLATLYKLQGKVDNAVEVAKKGTTANPSNVLLYELLVAMTMDNKDGENYAAAVSRLKELDPANQLLAVLKEQ